jgi:xylulokinase
LTVGDAGCLGAAVLAAVGVGTFRGVNDAAGAMAKIETRFNPDPGQKDRYDRMCAAFTAATEALKQATRCMWNS